MSLPKQNRFANACGFTLIEAVVAVGILMSFFASVTVIVNIVLNMVGESRVRLVATGLAQQKMEEVRNLSYDDLGVIGGIPSGVLNQVEDINVNGQDFRVRIGVVYIDDPFDGLAPDDTVNTDYKRVRVEVTWGGAYPSRSPVMLVTDVAPKGLEMMGSGGVLWINIINAVGEPVEGASVIISNDQVEPDINLEVISDSKGQVVLPGAPVCVTCYRIEVNKSGYSNDRTYDTSEVTNPLQPAASIIFGEVTQRTFAIDRTASLSVLTTGSRANNYPPFAGVHFILRGSKVIGTDEMDQLVYRFSQNVVSGQGGMVTVSDLAWDTYQIILPTGSSIDIAGSVPTNPFSLLPGQNRSLWMVTTAASMNSLLVVVQDDQKSLIEAAQVRLEGPTGTVSAGLTGSSSKGDFGQTWFGGLSELTYSIYASRSGYLEASSSALVIGDKVEIIQLEKE